LKKFAQNPSLFIPIAKKIVETGRSSGSPGFLRLPVPTCRNSGFDSETFLSGLTAAGTAPELHRIPFSIHPIGKDRNET
jgi:hypothetical protein